jgi:1-acyl-sn-glycerol-3-phosphate acyltransferase
MPFPSAAVGILRAQVNRLFGAVALLVALPLIAIGEKVRAGGGRAMAVGIIRTVARLCGVRFEVRGVERLGTAASVVLVPNHSSILDIPAMLVALPHVRFMAGSDLYSHRLLALAMRALGTVPIDRKNAREARRQIKALSAEAQSTESAPLCLTIFAEGQIAPPGTRLPFKTGAFVVAIETGATVVPVAIAHADEVLPPKAWLAIRPGVITIDFLDPIPTVGLTTRDRNRVRDQASGAVLAALAKAG